MFLKLGTWPNPWIDSLIVRGVSSQAGLAGEGEEAFEIGCIH